MKRKIIFGKVADSLTAKFIFEEELKQSNLPSSFKASLQECFYSDKSNVLYVGLGKKKDVKLDYYRRAASASAKTASVLKIDKIHFSIDLGLEETISVFEGAALGNYSFDKYKSEDDKTFMVKTFSFPEKSKQFSKELNEANIICENVFMVRDLVSDNSDVVTPELFEQFSRKVARKEKMKITVLREKELAKLGMNLILEVGKASKVPPRLIILEYFGDKDLKEKFMVAGKGITFDSGGLDIKMRQGMLDMRMDMAGAAIALGIIKSASELNLKKNLIAVLALAENLVDANSFRPGDIMKSFSGKTVENINTDAEGRLVLADALNYGVKKYSPKAVFEFSTLTGAMVVALGSHCAGMLSNNDEYAQKMFNAGEKTYERVWRLPLYEEYLEEVKSDRADFRSLNKTGDNGGIFAGAFLTKFVEDKPFVHIDVAGTAMLEEPKPYMPKNGSGFGVRLGVEFLKSV